MPLFSSDVLTRPEDNELEVSIFGSGYGESIVIHIPHVGWGIIDSCVQKFDGQPIVPPLEYLLEILDHPYPKLAFFILTHPHEDHCKGIDKIIKGYPGGIERVCRYDGFGLRELRAQNANKNTELRRIVPGLVYAFRAMNEAKDKGSQLKDLSEMTLVFDKRIKTENDCFIDIRMMALSPSAESKVKYREELIKAINIEEGSFLVEKDCTDHNLISVALVLTVGNLQVVFGGDVEAGTNDETGWSGIVSNVNESPLWAHIVKVPHHGSENAHNDLAWERFCSRGKPIALVAPFLNGSVALPKESDIERIKALSQKVGVTGYTNLETRLKKYYTRDVVRSIESTVRTMKIIERPAKPGLIRVRYTLDGKMTDHIAKPPAKWYE
jgi:beta-lactamase superfamily II metal-dependent hydrolase